jgi:hypothetical protein
MLLTQVSIQSGARDDDGTRFDPKYAAKDQNRAESPRNGHDVGVDASRDEVCESGFLVY